MRKKKLITGREDQSLPDKTRLERELDHHRWIAEEDTETLWGWGTPAGRLRAKRRARLIVSSANLQSGMHVLEIGCGTGVFTEMFLHTGIQLTAIDLSPDILAKAKARGLPKNKVTFVETCFEEYQVESLFDAVIGSSVLHHLVVNESLDKVIKILKPGGVFSFAEPNLLNPQIFIERTFPRLFPSISHDESAFIRWQLSSLLQKKGFIEPQIIPFDWLHPNTPVSLIGAVEAFGRILEYLPVIREFSGSLLIRGKKP